MMRCLAIMAILSASNLTAQPAPATGSVSGQVVDADSRTPLPGVPVRANGQRAVTDSAGRFRFMGLPVGPADVSVGGDDIGYAPAPPRNITILNGRDTADLDLPVRLKGSLSGKVTDENGDGVVGVSVLAIGRQFSRAGHYAGSQEFANGALWTLVVASTVSDDRGHYALSVPAGRPHVVVAHQPRTYSNAVSDAPATSSGRPTVPVPTYYPNVPTMDAAVSLTIGSLERRMNIDIAMEYSPSRCLAATLLTPRGPERLSFALEDATIAEAQERPFATLRRSGFTGPDGKLRVCDLYQGRFQLSAFNANTRLGLPEYLSTSIVTITREENQDLKLLLDLPMTISGNIGWVDGTTEPDLPKAKVRIVLQPGGLVAGRQVFIPGDFSFVADPTQQYSLMVYGIAPPLYIKDIVYGGTSILHRTFFPSHGDGRLRIIVGRDSGTLTVAIPREDPGSPYGTWVVVMRSDVQSEAELATGVIAGHASVEGAFTATGLAPGTYYVLAGRGWLPGTVTLPAGEVSLDKLPSTLSALIAVRRKAEKVEVSPNGTTYVKLPVGSLLKSLVQ